MLSLIRLFLGASALAVLAGCSAFVTSVQSAIEKQQVGSADYKYLVYQTPAILDCIKAPGGQCKAKTDMSVADVAARVPGKKADVVRRLVAPLISPAKLADAPPNAPAILAASEVVTNPTAQKLEVLFQRATGQDTSTDAVQFSRAELQSFGKSIQDATSLNGWGQLRTYLAAKKQTLDVGDQSAVDSAMKQMTLIEAYLDAYFSSGRFLSITVDVSTPQQSFVAELGKYGVGASDAQTLFSRMSSEILGKTPENGKIALVAKMTDGGFVTRGGTKYVFSGISVTIDPTSANLIQASRIDFTQVGSDIVRIVLEATGDELAQLPADKTSTACLLKTNGDLTNYPALKCYSEAEQQVTSQQFADVNTRASQVEAVAATATGQLIRGVSWISLNNEALAKLIETAVGVAARKATEKVAWCYYACTNAKSAIADVGVPTPLVRTIRMNFSQ
jgi:hypothetical protein